MEYKKDWSQYYDITRTKPARELLIEALSYVKSAGKAIDIGGGALRDTKYLLEKGFDVTVIDKSPLLEKEVRELKNKRLHFVVTSFADFKFPVNEYILASAMHSLPFCEPTHFSQVVTNIKSSLEKGGIFCGQMFGDCDMWADNPEMSYHTIDQAKELLKDLELIIFREEKDFDTLNGETKCRHIFHFIARK